MSDHVSIQVAIRLKPDAPNDLADRVMDILGNKGGSSTIDAETISLGESISIPAMNLPDGLDGAVVVDGHLYVDAYSSNAQRPRERLDGRTQLGVFVDLLDAYGDAPVGAIVGAVYGDWSEGSDAGPMIVTGAGVAMFSSGYDSTARDHGFGSWMAPPEPPRVSVTSISPAVAARLTRGTDEWSDGWGSCTSADEAEIAAWARAQAANDAPST